MAIASIRVVRPWMAYTPGWLTEPSTVTFCDTDAATITDTCGLTR